jgi:hypothetical protein
VRFFLQHPLTNPFSKVNLLAFKKDGQKKQVDSDADEGHPFATPVEKEYMKTVKLLQATIEHGV